VEIKKILKLTIKKQWFDLILSGKKTHEYREVKKHWDSRLYKNRNLIMYDEILFINGYGAHRPYMLVKFNNVKKVNGNIVGANNEILNKEEYYKISLGKVVQSGNIS